MVAAAGQARVLCWRKVQVNPTQGTPSKERRVKAEIALHWVCFFLHFLRGIAHLEPLDAAFWDDLIKLKVSGSEMEPAHCQPLPVLSPHPECCQSSLWLCGSLPHTQGFGQCIAH